MSGHPWGKASALPRRPEGLRHTGRDAAPVECSWTFTAGPSVGRLDDRHSVCIVRITPVGRQRGPSHRHPLVLACIAFGLLQGGASAQTLRGSASSLDLQTTQAARHDFTYLPGTAQLRRFVDAGLLVSVGGNRDYTLKDVSFPFARPSAKLFIERLAGQYRRACGERLVVTSLTRPRSHQPRNASDRSVHPTGMALDLRRPQGTCRQWLERTLLYLEGQAVLEATAEHSPPHYHVAVFPGQYAAYVERLTALAVRGNLSSPSVYTVRPGDTLWEIAQRHGTSTRTLRRTNGLSSTRIYPGQALRVPEAH